MATLRARVAALTDSQKRAAAAAALSAVKQYREQNEEQKPKPIEETQIQGQQQREQEKGPLRRTLEDGQSVASSQSLSSSPWNASNTPSTQAAAITPPTAVAAAGGGGGGTCGSWLKVYFYEFPEDLPFMKLARDFKQSCFNENKCDSQYGGENLLAQFSLELILADFFRQSCVRTMDPEEAHFFYVPFFHDVEYR